MNIKQRFAALLVRLILPACILAGGWYGFRQLSIPMEEESVEQPEPTQVRTRVQPLEVGSYQVHIETHGLMSPHNQVTLSAEVTGRIVKINPEFRSWAFFFGG